MIDEAHNLVERGRDMYSAALIKEDFLALKKAVKDYDSQMYRQLERCNKELLELKRECGDYNCESEATIAPFVRNLNRLSAVMSDYLEENESSPVKEKVQDYYFEVSHFLLKNDDHVSYTHQTLPTKRIV